MGELDGRGTEARGARSDATPREATPAVGKATLPEEHAPSRGRVFGVTGENKREARNVQHWNATGIGGEYELADTNPKGEDAKIAAPGVAQADLSRVAVDPTRSWGGPNGIYRESVFGSYLAPTPQVGPTVVTDGTTTAMSLFQTGGAAGARERIGIRRGAQTDGELGTAKASTDAFATAEAGMSGNIVAHNKGIEAGGAISARAVAGVNADADVKTHGIAIPGVDRPLDAGAGVHADATVGARAGIGGRAGITKDFVGVEMSAGAFAGGEAAANVHANAGPLTVRAGVSGIAGAGAGIDGGIVYDHGKIKLRGKALLAFGFGGSGRVEVELDVNQAIQLGVVTAHQARELADANHDGAITLTDGATVASNAMVGTAATADRAVDRTLASADANHDGKLGLDDAAIHARTAAATAARTATHAVTDATTAIRNIDVRHIGHTIDGALDRTGASLAHHADLDRDGKLGLGDAKVAVEHVERGVTHIADEVHSTSQAVAARTRAAADLDHDGHVDAKDVQLAARTVQQQAQATVHHALAAGARTTKAIDRAMVAAGKRLRSVGTQDLTVTVQQANHLVASAIDTAKQKAQQAGRAVAASAASTADRNHDGHVDVADAATAATELRAGVSHAVTAATQAVQDGKRELAEAGHVLHQGVEQAGSIATGTIKKLWKYLR